MTSNVSSTESNKHMSIFKSIFNYATAPDTTFETVLRVLTSQHQNMYIVSKRLNFTAFKLRVV